MELILFSVTGVPHYVRAVGQGPKPHSPASAKQHSQDAAAQQFLILIRDSFREQSQQTTKTIIK